MEKQKIMYEITIKKYVYGERPWENSKEGEKTVLLYEDEKIKSIYDWLSDELVVRRKNGS